MHKVVKTALFDLYWDTQEKNRIPIPVFKSAWTLDRALALSSSLQLCILLVVVLLPISLFRW